MSPHLEAALKAKYPVIFGLLNKPGRGRMPISQWGIECGDGWYAAIDELCAKLQAGANKGDFKQPVVAQVKQKIGKMQFYLVEEGPQYDGLIYEAAIGLTSPARSVASRARSVVTIWPITVKPIRRPATPTHDVPRTRSHAL